MRIKSTVIVMLWLINISFPFGKNEEKLFYPALVDKFYTLNQNKIFWFNRKDSLRQELIDCIDTCSVYNLIFERYHYKKLTEDLSPGNLDSSELLETDKVFTDAAIACMKDVYEGYKLSPWIQYDQVSDKYANINDQFLLQHLNNIRLSGGLKDLMKLLEPNEKEYQFLKEEIKIQKQAGNKDKVQQLSLSMNYFRWIRHFHFDKCIVINIPSAYLRYYERDSQVLFMKAVLGKPSSPTPRLAVWCDQVILYPYWYVPRKIALNEYLPNFKKDPELVDELNMQVIDDNGKIIDYHKLDWSSFSKNYFPYSLRQSTGCDNALGVIKFDLISPYGVFLHDTNNKTAFFSGLRYYSHGCIRIEEPIELANRLLKNQLDTAFLQACYKDQKPIIVPLDAAVPVFIIYAPAESDRTGKIHYYKDVYSLLK